MALERIEYTEYSEEINIHGDSIEVIVQIPHDLNNQPIHIIDKSGSRYLKRTFEEWLAINDVVAGALNAEATANSILKRALEEAGYEIKDE